MPFLGPVCTTLPHPGSPCIVQPGYFQQPHGPASDPTRSHAAHVPYPMCSLGGPLGPTTQWRCRDFSCMQTACELTLRQSTEPPPCLSHSALRLRRGRSPQTRVGAICSIAIFQMLAGMPATPEK